MASKGAVGKAAAACVPSSVAAKSDETFKTLQALHPPGPSAADLLPIKEGFSPDGSIILHLTPEDTYIMLSKGFKKGVAPGPDGLKGEVLLQMSSQRNVERKASFLRDLTGFLNAVLEGKLSEKESALFAAARLIPLKKDDHGGVRPVAIGKIVRRYLGRFAVRRLMSLLEGTTTFLPQQVGLGVKSPCEGLIHAVNQAFSDDSPEIMMLQLDAKNAFNMANRSNFLTLTSQNPKLKPIFHLAFLLYGYRPSLFVEGFGKTITSAMGTMQGCSLGSFMYCVGVQPLAVGISNLVPQLTANAWLADDANIVGKPEDVSRAYKYIKAEGPKYGYVLNESKSKIYAPGIDLRANDLATLFPVDIPRIHAKGIKMLGGLVSKDGPFVTEYLKNLMNQNEVAMLNCAALDDAQASYLILRDSLGFSKYAHLFRTTDPTLALEGARHFDVEIGRTMESIMGCSTSQSMREFMGLPIKMGGIALISCEVLAPVVFMASCKSTQNLVCGTFGPNTTSAFLYQTRAMCLIQSATNQICAKHTSMSKSKVDAILADAASVDYTGFQKALTATVYSALVTELRASADLSTMQKAGLLMGEQKHTGDWLHALPTKDMRCAHALFQTMLRTRLSLLLPCQTDVVECPLCDKMTDLATHALSCPNGNDKLERHEKLLHVFSSFLGNALSVKVNPKKVLSDAATRPADLIIDDFENGKKLCVDLTVANVDCKSYQSWMRKYARGEDALGLAEKVADLKRSKHREACERNGFLFVPFAMESYGGFASETMELIEKVCSRVAAGSMKKRTSVSAYLFKKLSITLQKANALATIRRMRPLSPAQDVEIFLNGCLPPT